MKVERCKPYLRFCTRPPCVSANKEPRNVNSASSSCSRNSRRRRPIVALLYFERERGRVSRPLVLTGGISDESKVAYNRRRQAIEINEPGGSLTGREPR
jgi:hypothetical protein